MKFAPEKIKEIAEEIGMDMRCYVHRTTGEVLMVPNHSYDEMVGMVGEDCVDKEPYEKLENDGDSYHQIEKMASFESFKVMEDFIENTDLPRSLKGQLYLALDKRKPFRQFKYVVENSDYRLAWFAYRDKRREEHVAEQLSFLQENDP